FAEKRQVEQPFAGIIDNVDTEPAAREHSVPARCGLIFDGQPQFRDGAGGLRPGPGIYQRVDMVFILEARDGVIRLFLEEGPGNAARLLSLEKRQPSTMDQVMDEGGDEDGLARAG